ncbi:hypothetical protein CANARDRAFT_204804 [[Candida] arabinofermentans NRRL YB-2248]|uniref:Uncharacterized protein n=1 Tax=[Candida] arabinofermentans NRRL YB-2248 TaxID=983967 RepID=A0A1E4SSZ5_9ASCO|nr:hypothetical protein CANARDRAFT_204804 [[Candida] arabinofermentans NRRL YB-2248]
MRGLTATDLTSNLLKSPISKVITILFVYTFIILTIYETILNLGVYFNLWNPPGHDVFVEYPAHCAHLYVSLNITQSSTSDVITNYKNVKRDELLLVKPIVYHFEFSPDEYSDPDYGTTLKFLRSKVLKWFQDSVIYAKHKDEFSSTVISNIYLFDKKGDLLENDDEFLCNLGITTGSTIKCLVQL